MVRNTRRWREMDSNSRSRTHHQAVRPRRGRFPVIGSSLHWPGGIEVEFVAVPFEQVQRTLEDGRAEAVFPLTITPERLPLFDFSDPFLVTGGALFVRAPNRTPQGLG